MKRRKINFKRAVSYLLTACMAVGIVFNAPANVVKAEAATVAPSAYSYASKAELATNYGVGKPYAARVVFGKNTGGAPQEWFILGTETGNDIVMFAVTPIATGQQFYTPRTGEDIFDPYYARAYDPNSGCSYQGGTVSTVSSVHYGTSDLRIALQGLAANNFAAPEQSLMNMSTITTWDRDNSLYYTTQDILYPLFVVGTALEDADASNDIIYAGSANQIQILTNVYPLPGETPSIYLTSPSQESFWLRSSRDIGFTQDYTVTTFSNYSYDDYSNVNVGQAVRPAFDLNLAPVLFASAAPTTAGGGAISPVMAGDGVTPISAPMYLRLDGSQLVASTAYKHAGKIAVYPKSGETVNLVIQGNDGTNDWYYSQTVGGTDVVTVDAATVQTALTLPDAPDFSVCKVWIEKADAEGRLAYAKEAGVLTEVNNIDVTVSAPVGGQALPTNGSSSTAGVASVALTWTTGGNPAGATAEYETEYSVTAVATMAEGYVLTAGATGTMNGATADTFIVNADGTATYTKAFPATGEAPSQTPPSDPGTNDPTTPPSDPGTNNPTITPGGPETNNPTVAPDSGQVNQGTGGLTMVQPPLTNQMNALYAPVMGTVAPTASVAPTTGTANLGEKDEVPDTGDSSNTMLWLAVVLVSGGMALAFSRKSSLSEEN